MESNPAAIGLLLDNTIDNTTRQHYQPTLQTTLPDNTTRHHYQTPLQTTRPDMYKTEGSPHGFRAIESYTSLGPSVLFRTFLKGPFALYCLISRLKMIPGHTMHFSHCGKKMGKRWENTSGKRASSKTSCAARSAPHRSPRRWQPRDSSCSPLRPPPPTPTSQTSRSSPPPPPTLPRWRTRQTPPLFSRRV